MKELKDLKHDINLNGHSIIRGKLIGVEFAGTDEDKAKARESLGVGGESDPSSAVLYTSQSLSDSQKNQARSNIGAGTYSKPNGGIPASDLAPGAIPSGITLLELSSDIGTLTSEQLALVQTNNCVIKYTGNTSGLKGLYHKSYDSADGLDYSKIQETKSNDDVRSYYFTCIKSTGEYNFGTDTDARPRVVGNPTIQEGTTPTTLRNLRIGFTDYAIPQGGGGTDSDAVHFTQQSLTAEQQAQARTNIGAGTYSKPSGGIPASDLASGVIPDAVEANPTVPQGTTPTDLANLKVGNNYYAIPQGGGGGGANAQVRASTEAGASGEGDICNSQVILTDGYLTGAEDGVYNLVSLSGNLVIRSASYSIDYRTADVSRWTGSEFELVLSCNSIEGGVSIYDVKNEDYIPGGSNISLADYFTPDSGNVAKIQLSGEFEAFTFNVGENNATTETIMENFGGTFYKRMPSTDAVRFSGQSLTSEQEKTARRNIGAASTGDIDICQKRWDVGNESYDDGDITQRRKVTPTGNDLVNTFTQDYLTGPTLRAVGASVFDTTGETVTIHDDDMNIDLFRIVVEAGNNYADVYDKEGELVGSVWEGSDYDMEIEDDYSSDSITIASTASSSNISIYQCRTDILRYEVYDEQPCPRIPSYPEIADTQPPGGFEPNKVYNVGPYLAVPITFKLADPKYDNVDNIYRWNFYTQSWYPTVTWPTGVIWEGGTAPTIAASTYYEIRIRKAGSFLLGSFKTYPLV